MTGSWPARPGRDPSSDGIDSVEVVAAAPDPAALARVIGRFVDGPVDVDRLSRYSGGASRETWAVDATDAAGDVHRLVLRRDHIAQANAAARATEYALLAAADAGGVPVPRSPRPRRAASR